jgi:cation:H+ antiporter
MASVARRRRLGDGAARILLMDWLLNISYLACGLVALYFGAEWLVGGSSQLALRLGLTPLVVGLTVVALGTSAPEMFVSIGFNMRGLPDAAVGNVVGSNICNIALILGLSALIRPLAIKRQIVVREMPILLGASLILIAMLWDRELARWEGAVLTLGIVVYVVTSLRLAKDAGRELKEEFAEEFVEEGPPEEPSKTPLIFTLLILAGLLALVLGSHLLQMGAVFIAQGFGVSEAIIGLTLLAFGTSLPELATSVVACMKNQGDIVAGNAVGSSIFNIFAILGVTALIKEMPIKDIEPVDLGVMLLVTVAIVPMMVTKRSLGRFEGGLLLAGYLTYVVSLAMRG